VSELREAIEILRNDPAFRRGFRRGIGLILAIWVAEQCLVCALWPIFFRR
jgi:hypothetical protein